MACEHSALIIKHKYSTSSGKYTLLVENQILQIKNPNLAPNRNFIFRFVILFLHKILSMLKI